MSGSDLRSDLTVLSTRAVDREPVHPSITSAQISELVERFYAQVCEDERLGSIFEARVQGEWPRHLDRMKSFWSSVLLRSGSYKGQPVPVHMALSEVASDDFQRWLLLFRRTALAVFEAQAAGLVIAAAERIARSLWLAMFGTVSNNPPAWISSEPA